MTLKSMYVLFSLGLSKRFWMMAITLFPYLFLNIHFIEKNDQRAAAPDFSLADLEGNVHQLSQYDGQYVVLEWLNFRCRAVDLLYKSGAIPGIQNQFNNEDIVWLTITSSAIGKGEGTISVDQLKRQVEKRGGQQDAVLLDETGHVGKLYGVHIVPYFVVISPDSEILYEGAFDDMPDPRASRNEDVFNYVKAALDEARSGEEVRITTAEPYGCEVKYQR